jgi:linoleate 10R-lipoxygenase
MANEAQSQPPAPTEFDKVRAQIGSGFTEWAASLSAGRRPLPDQTGDGTYLTKDDPTLLQNLAGDLKQFSYLGVKDWKTLAEVGGKTATGAMWDDSKYLMENLIQVRFQDPLLNRGY